LNCFTSQSLGISTSFLLEARNRVNFPFDVGYIFARYLWMFVYSCDNTTVGSEPCFQIGQDW